MKLDNIIVLHRDYDNKIILIDIEKISAISETDNTTLVYTDNADFSVRENIAGVLVKIRSVKNDKEWIIDWNKKTWK